MAGMIDIHGPDGTFSAYLAAPKSECAPGLVLLQEIFGVNAFMRQTAENWAARGFLCVVPDLFWRLRPGVELDPGKADDRTIAGELMSRFDRNAAVRDIQAAIDHVRQMAETTGRVGTIGYCLGGHMAYLAAALTDIDVSIGYYGVGIDKRLDLADRIRCPLVLHIAGKDEHVPTEAQSALKNGLGDNPKITLYEYPGTGHGFARRGGAHFDNDASGLADQRSNAILHRVLGA